MNIFDLIYHLPEELHISYFDFNKLSNIITSEANKIDEKLTKILKSFNLNDSNKRTEIFNNLSKKEKELFFILYNNIKEVFNK